MRTLQGKEEYEQEEEARLRTGDIDEKHSNGGVALICIQRSERTTTPYHIFWQ